MCAVWVIPKTIRGHCKCISSESFLSYYRAILENLTQTVLVSNVDEKAKAISLHVSLNVYCKFNKTENKPIITAMLGIFICILYVF